MKENAQSKACAPIRVKGGLALQLGLSPQRGACVHPPKADWTNRVCFVKFFLENILKIFSLGEF
uniref:Uncharacterized protein n=1 Tax=candidate division WOR-3 bacterium TaxID=2052148 RepID=A0A7C6A8X4_UNCW3